MSEEIAPKCECNCTGNCCDMDCPCFKRGSICSKNCKCPNCQNKSVWGEERTAAIEEILAKDSTAFTQTDLNQEERSLISNFSMLSASIDSTPFKTQPRSSPLSRLLTPEVTGQAIKTVISAATRNLTIEGNNNEESTENCVSAEFENVLKTVLNAVESQ